jgi:hypothetical protein
VKTIVKFETKRAWKKPATNCFNVFIAAIALTDSFDHRHHTRATVVVAVPWRGHIYEEETNF